MNDKVKEAAEAIDEELLANSSENNCKMMFADDDGYTIKDTDVLYIISGGRLEEIRMNELALIGWHETEEYVIDNDSSTNYYLHKPTGKMVLCELTYQHSNCIAIFSDRSPADVPSMAMEHHRYFIDLLAIRRYKISRLLD
ncbi:hypothetical protein TH61_16315 [Rufibacter sp. DG15C]|uniref:hypothetical protein n=1 Tax=Rufibacter sp. DG15C TaxID=1379909 RepID=UPI00078E5093|nr:hypothetical protein [Rufibacter sp. DG15C]AMM52441.1 hypothetical protein TH61_16315 [Rufibacter sp. DG15C]